MWGESEESATGSRGAHKEAAVLSRQEMVTAWDRAMPVELEEGE